MIAKSVEALAVSGDEVPVEEVLVDDDAAHRERERAIGAGLDRKPLIGLLRGLGEVGIDDHELAAALLRLDELPALPQTLIGPEVVHSPQDHVAGVDEVMHRKDVAEQREACRTPVLLASRRMRIHVGATVQVPEQMPVEDGVGVVMAGERHRLRSPFLLDIGKPDGDEVEGFIPRCPAKSTRLPFRVGAQHRVFQPIRILRHPPARHPLRAPCSNIVRRL